MTSARTSVFPTFGTVPSADSPTVHSEEVGGRRPVMTLAGFSVLLGVLGFASAAEAKIPMFNATCPTGIEVHADAGGPIYINGKQATLKTFNQNYYEAKRSGVTISLSINPDGSPAVSYTGAHGANGVCAVSMAGSGNQGSSSADVPEIAVRSNGQMEVRWRSGCTMLYNSSGHQVQSGTSCTESQRGRSDDAVAGYMREQGAGDDAGAGPLEMRGIGQVTQGGPLIGKITSKNGRSFALILTATQEGFTCTGSFDERPGSQKSMSTTIHCTNGANGSAILKGDLLTFSAGGKGGLVRFN